MLWPMPHSWPSSDWGLCLLGQAFSAMPVTSPSINAFPPFSQILKCTWIPTPRFSFNQHFEGWGILFCSDVIGNMVLALMHINFVIIIPIKHFQLNFKSYFRGFPGSGRESVCQFRGHGFHSWSGKNPHAAGQLSLWAATTEPLVTTTEAWVAQTVKNLPAMQETWVQSLCWEDPWRREWQPTPVFLPEESI